jgi:hypothetical protein
MAVLKGVEVMWACVQVPNTKFNSEGEWSIDVVKLTPEHVIQLQTDAKAADPKGCKIKNEDDGTKSFKFKRKCFRADKLTKEPVPNDKPKVLDAQGNEVKTLVGNGSICDVQYAFVPYDNKFGKGVTTDLKAIKIISLVAFGAADGDEFEFNTPTEQPKASNEYDDGDFN